MNGVVIMSTLLRTFGPVTDIVGAEIYAGNVPQSATLPALGIKEISRVEQDTAAREGGALVTARIQVTVQTKSYPQQKALLLATKLGGGVHTGLIAGVEVRSVLRDAIGPDLSDDDAQIFEQSRDFKVTYIEP